jgi:hypothetical protein
MQQKAQQAAVINLHYTGMTGVTKRTDEGHCGCVCNCLPVHTGTSTALKFDSHRLAVATRRSEKLDPAKFHPTEFNTVQNS